ncbi:uncharacterized protein LOC135125715 [Zophobas morio]|uniref:uncharacterized protein LOC135125715 n=1 Tax=Zophobas morio TaxID=2755281 RepID=UPI003083A571
MGKVKGSVWNHYIETTADIYQCKYCKKHFKKNATRQFTHLKNCLKISPENKKELLTSTQKFTEKSDIKSDKETADNNHDALCSSNISTVSTVTLCSACSSNSTTSTTKLQNIRPFFDEIHPNEKQKLDNLFARAVFVSGSPLSMSESDVWLQFFQSLRPCYQLPSRYILSTSLLDTQFEEIQSCVKSKISEASVLTLQCDQWSNVRNDSITNYVINTPTPVFYKTEHTKSNRHTSEFLKKEIKLVLEEIGVHKFLAIITDNGANIRKARREIHNEFSYMLEYGCICHSLNLLVEDILKLDEISNFKKSVTAVVKEIKNSHVLQARLKEIQEEKNKVSLSLKLPVRTRWNSFSMCLGRLLRLKQILKLLCVDPAAENFMSNLSKSSLLDDREFWPLVTKLYSLFAPISKWITLFESDEPHISKVADCFHEINKMLQEKFDDDDDNFGILDNIFKQRKSKSLGPIHYLANLLDPSQKGKKLTNNEIITATELFYQIAEKHPKYCEFFEEIIEGFAQYRAGHGIFSKEFVKKSENAISPLTWWSGLCSTSKISTMAADILSLPSSTAATERTFSRYATIHTAKRNRLTVERAGKLTFIAHNIQLGKSKSKLNHAASSISNEDDDIDNNEDDHNSSDEDYDFRLIAD